LHKVWARCLKGFVWFVCVFGLLARCLKCF
jgi:hypothetical protein